MWRTWKKTFVELKKKNGGGVTHLSEREQTSSAFFLRPRMNEVAQTAQSPGFLWYREDKDFCVLAPRLQLNYWFRLIPNGWMKPTRIKDTFHEWIFYRGTVTQAAPAWVPVRFVSTVNHQIAENSKSDLLHERYTGSSFWALFGSSPFCIFQIFEGSFI